MLFNATLDRLSESELEALVTEHQASCKNQADVRSATGSTLTILVSIIRDKGAVDIQIESAQSLLMIGAIALHKYQSVNPA